MEFKVLYSQEKDIWNFLNSVWRFTYLKHGRTDIRKRLLSNFPQNFRDDLNRAKTKEEGREKIMKYLEWRQKNYANTTPIIIDWLEKNINKKKGEIITKLEKIYQQKFPFSKIIIYLTTVNIFPYSYKDRWFMSGKYQSLENHISTALHELNHFMFYYYYPGLKKELGVKRYEILKEALAIYTNPEGNNKPDVKKMENYFRQNLDKSIPEVIEKGEWKNHL